MNPSRQLLRVSPIERTVCLELYSLVSFVASASNVDLLLYECREEAQEFAVQLVGERTGLVKVCFLVQQDYPHLEVSLEPLDDRHARAVGSSLAS